MTITFDERKHAVSRMLLAIVAVFAAGDVALTLLSDVGGKSVPRGIQLLLDLGVEGGVPTLYSSAQLLLAAGLLAVIAVRKRHTATRLMWDWGLLAVGFAFLSLDEFASIHEEWGRFAPGVTRTGFFYFRWIVVALVLLPVVGLLFLPLLRSLSTAFRREFLAAGVIFVGSAVGLEGVGGAVASRGFADTLGYNLLNVAENGGEMVGIALFISSLLRYLATEVPQPVHMSAPDDAISRRRVA